MLGFSDRGSESSKSMVGPVDGPAGRSPGVGRRGDRLIAACSLRPSVTVRRAVLLATVSLAGVLPSSAAASVAGPTVATAPGRVVLSVDGGAITGADAAGTGNQIVSDHGDPGGGQDPGVALPDGGAVVSASAAPGPAEIVELAANGELDPSFGSGGVVRVGVDLPEFLVSQIVRQPDGKLVLVGDETPDPNSDVATRLVLVRLDPDGSLDESFGSAGVDVLPLVGSCASCVALAVRSGGGLVVTGTAGAQSATAGHIGYWVVEGLTSTGAPDPSFGQSGVVMLAQNGAGAVGVDLAVLPDGDIVTLGAGYFSLGSPYGYEVDRLLPSGAPDPAFGGGAPVALPSAAEPVASAALDGGMVAFPDGSVIVDVSHGVVRFTPAGVPDATFGEGGIAQTGPPGEPYEVTQLFPSPGDGALVILESDAAYGQDRVERITGSGAIDPTLGGPAGLDFTTPFGGGISHVAQFPPVLTLLGPLAQNTFTGGSVIERPDGSYLFLGQVAIAWPTGNSSVYFAAAALTPSFALDRSFGGPVTPLHATLALTRQGATTAHARRGIRVTLNLSASGLARLVIKAGGRVVAQSLYPVFRPGTSTLRVILTSFGYQWLRSDPHGTITASVKARDLLTTVATATATGTLH
jgi:uncharacterized delta-60 repeat protein